MNIARQTAVFSIMAVGMTFVLASAEIDLSFGAVIALSAVITALMLRWTQNIALALAAGMICGVLVGAVNGLLVGFVGIPSFLVTLGMTGIVIGITRWISSLQSIPVDNGLFTFIFGSGDILGIPILFFWTLIVAVLGFIVLNKTVFGRSVLATGGNYRAALYSGINVRRIKFFVLVLNAWVASFVGILYVGRLQGARYTLGENDLMIVIASVIIGGTSLFGGNGRIIGSVLGALIMGMLNNGLVLMNLSVDHQLIARGTIIIVSVLVMTQGAKKRS